MKSIFILACALACVLALRGPQVPIWPQTFSQDYVISGGRYKVYETGKLWFDDVNKKSRLDYSGSNFVEACLRLGNEDKSTSCSMISVRGALYINLPQKSKCCMCCKDGDNCNLIQRDWMKDFTYAGEATLSGQTFYKWSYGPQASYYATMDAERVPRRAENEGVINDFIMNTYSTSPISDTVFNIPSNCKNLCPAGSGCRNSLQQTKFTRESHLNFE